MINEDKNRLWFLSWKKNIVQAFKFPQKNNYLFYTCIPRLIWRKNGKVTSVLPDNPCPALVPLLENIVLHAGVSSLRQLLVRRRDRWQVRSCCRGRATVGRRQLTRVRKSRVLAPVNKFDWKDLIPPENLFQNLIWQYLVKIISTIQISFENWSKNM